MHRRSSAHRPFRHAFQTPSAALHASLLIGLVVACAGPPPREATAPRTSDPRVEFETAPEETAPANGRAYTLTELLELAQRRSPDLAVSRSLVQAASGRHQQAGMWANPRLDFEAEEIPASGLALGEAKTTLGIEQPLDLGGRRRAATAVAEAEERAERWALEGARRRLAGLVCQDWIEIQSLRRALRELETAVAAAEGHAELARKRFAAQAAPESELLRAEVELEGLRLELDGRSSEMVPLIASLSSRLGGLALDEARIGAGSFGTLPPVNRERLRAAVRDSHPAVVEASERQRAAERGIERAAAERWPDFGLRLAWGRIGATEESIWELGFSLPLPLWNRHQGGILESRALAAAARHRTEALQAEILAELEAQLAAYQRALHAADRLEQALVPASQRAVELTAARYRAGEASLLELLDAQRAQVGARLGLVNARRQAELSLVRLWTLASPALALPGVDA